MLRPKYILKPQHLPYWRRHPDLNWGIKLLQSSALPLGYGALFNYIFVFYNYAHILKFLSCFNNYDKRRKNMRLLSVGAEDEIRTRDVHLGKVTLYH